MSTCQIHYGLPDGKKKNYPDFGSDRDMGLKASAKRTHSTTVTGFPIRVFEVIMISQLCSVKVLVDKKNNRGCRGARVKGTTITAIKCVCADGRYLNTMKSRSATQRRTKRSLSV